MRSSLVAVAVLASALVVSACDKKSDAPPAPVSSAPVSSAPIAAPGALRVTADRHGFSPASLNVPAGAPGSKIAVQFVRTTDETCATEVVFPDLGVKRDLPLNQIVAVELPGGSARTLNFQCGMGMFKGQLVVK
jgi:hypothetical protein